MLSASEVVDLVIALVLLPIILTSSRTPSHRRRVLLFAAYIAIVCGYVFTIAEGFFWYDTMNLLEHASYAVSGILAVIALADYHNTAKRGGQR